MSGLGSVLHDDQICNDGDADGKPGSVSMQIKTVQTKEYQDQRPGTSGLRKKVKVFQEPGYLEHFVQAIFEAVPEHPGATLILGGDGRYFNRQAIQIILKMAAANGWGKVVVGQDGILSTPALSHLIRKRKALGGIILTASHNPGGPEHDFGVKYNISNGGPAPESITEAIWAASKSLRSYRIADTQAEIDIKRIGNQQLETMTIEVCDSTADYIAMMEGIFDFNHLSDLLRSKYFTMRYDALHAVTGPYAHALFEKHLGAPDGTVVHGIPLEDFGGGHPDPNLIYAKSLVNTLYGEDAPDFGAASDGDGDRHMILGRQFFVSPCDSLAVMLAHADLIAHYHGQVKGVARSMPTSQAVDAVARDLHLPIFETPTGWKYFGDLMDADRVTFCGEESFGAGSTHIREKDGLWAVLFWLSIIAETQLSVAEIVSRLWQKYGRYYFSRHDYESLPTEEASQMMSHVRQQLSDLEGKKVGDTTIRRADDFRYQDPIDGSVAEHQGIRIHLADQSRIVMRLSGTGTTGSTLRFYFERLINRPDALHKDVQKTLQPLVEYAYGLTQVQQISQRTLPDVIT